MQRGGILVRGADIHPAGTCRAGIARLPPSSFGCERHEAIGNDGIQLDLHEDSGVDEAPDFNHCRSRFHLGQYFAVSTTDGSPVGDIGHEDSGANTPAAYIRLLGELELRRQSIARLEALG